MQLKYRKMSTEATPLLLHQNVKCTLRRLLDTRKSVSKPPARGAYPSLADVCPPSGRRVPPVLTRLVREMEAHLRVDDIYKRCTDAEEVETILRNIDTVDLSTIDAHTLAECIKMFLWQIEEPLIPSTHLNTFIGGLSAEDREVALRRCIESLPTANRDTLLFMMAHWGKVLGHSLHNGLTIASLATVFAPFVVGFSNERVSIDITQALLRIDC